jgi:type IV pilus assembly protein PilE
MTHPKEIAMEKQIQKQKGFTLIELLIVVAIIGILSTIALPAYTDYIKRGKLTEAMTELAGMRVRLEQLYQDNRNYGTTAAACGVAAPAAPNVKYFTFSCGWRTGLTPAFATDGTNQSFMVTATGIADTPTAGFVYTIDQNNAKQTTAVPTGWTASTTCWVTKKGGVC